MIASSDDACNILGMECSVCSVVKGCCQNKGRKHHSELVESSKKFLKSPVLTACTTEEKETSCATARENPSWAHSQGISETAKVFVDVTGERGPVLPTVCCDVGEIQTG